MQPSNYVGFDLLLGEAGADAIMRLAERWGTYKTYAEEPVFEGLGEGLPARFDAAFNFVKTGGRFGRRDEAEARVSADHSRNIRPDEIVERLVTDLRKPGRIDGETPDGRELAFTIVDEYVRFPEPRPEEA